MVRIISKTGGCNIVRHGTLQVARRRDECIRGLYERRGAGRTKPEIRKENRHSNQALFDMSIGVNQTDKAVLFGKLEQNWIGDNTFLDRRDNTHYAEKEKSNEDAF